MIDKTKFLILLVGLSYGSFLAQNSSSLTDFKESCEKSSNKPNFLYSCDCLTERYPLVVKEIKGNQLDEDINNRSKGRTSRDLNRQKLQSMCEQNKMVVLIKDSTRTMANPNGEVKEIYRDAKNYPHKDKISACDAVKEIENRPIKQIEDVPNPSLSEIWLHIKSEDCKDYDRIYNNGFLKSEVFISSLSSEVTNEHKEQFKTCFAKNYAERWLKTEGDSPGNERFIMSGASQDCKK